MNNKNDNCLIDESKCGIAMSTIFCISGLVGVSTSTIAIASGASLSGFSAAAPMLHGFNLANGINGCLNYYSEKLKSDIDSDTEENTAKNKRQPIAVQYMR